MSTVLADPRQSIAHARPAAGSPMTFDEFAASADLREFELIRGRLQPRKEMGAYANVVTMNVGAELVLFARRAGGYVMSSETVYRCFGEPNTGRRPDVSYVARGRFPSDEVPHGFVTIPPDLAIEVVSPNNFYEEVLQKVDLYLQHGFPEVWVISPVTRGLQIHRPGQPSLTLRGSDQVEGAGPLTGLSFPLASLFPIPAPAATAAMPSTP